MNEALWLAGTDPLALLADLHPLQTLGSVKPQSRRSRMYLLACARRQWPRLPGVCRSLVALAEVYADAPLQEESLRADVAPIAEQLMNSDGEPSDLSEAAAALSAVEHPATAAACRAATEPPTAPTPPLPVQEWEGLSRLVYLPFELYTPPYRWAPPKLHSLRLLREVFGNPYRHVPFDAAWRTDTALTLARLMYDRREFDRMHILADALQDAGCNDESLLEHCREKNQRHVRGCWVVDLVLNLK